MTQRPWAPRRRPWAWKSARMWSNMASAGGAGAAGRGTPERPHRALAAPLVGRGRERAVAQQALEADVQAAEGLEQQVGGQAGASVLLAEVQQRALDLQRGHLAAVTAQGVVLGGALAAQVHDLGARVEDHAPARGLQGPAVVHLLEVQEVA